MKNGFTMVLSGHKECVYMGNCCGDWRHRRGHVRQCRARPDPVFLFHFLIAFATNHSAVADGKKLGVHAGKGAKRRGPSAEKRREKAGLSDQIHGFGFRFAKLEWHRTCQCFVHAERDVEMAELSDQIH